MAKTIVVNGRLERREVSQTGAVKMPNVPSNIVGDVVKGLLGDKWSNRTRPMVNDGIRKVARVINGRLADLGYDPIPETTRQKTGSVSYRNLAKVATAHEVGFTTESLLDEVRKVK